MNSDTYLSQMLWGTSSLALYIPWAGGAGPYLGLSLWLWLGVLDAVQGVGLGMILLQTLSRLHVCATLAFSQIIGSVCVMIARATAPNAIGPGTVFPDAAKWDFSDGLKGWARFLQIARLVLIGVRRESDGRTDVLDRTLLSNHSRGGILLVLSQGATL